MTPQPSRAARGSAPKRQREDGPVIDITDTDSDDCAIVDPAPARQPAARGHQQAGPTAPPAAKAHAPAAPSAAAKPASAAPVPQADRGEAGPSHAVADSAQHPQRDGPSADRPPGAPTASAAVAADKAAPVPARPAQAATTLHIKSAVAGSPSAGTDHKELHLNDAPLPAAAATASRVLAELLRSHGVGGTCAVPVAPAAFDAWLGHLRPDYAGLAMHGTVMQQDAARCMHAATAEALQDYEYEAAMLADLSTALRAPGAQGRSAAWRPPTPLAEQRQRAQQMVAKLPTPLLLKVLGRVTPLPDKSPIPDAAAMQGQMPALAHLLLLLPPRFHPAVLRARCPSIATHRTLALPPLPLHGPSAGGGTYATASLATHALTAAAIFARGWPGAVWRYRPDTAVKLNEPGPRHLQLSAAPLPGLPPLPPLPPAPAATSAGSDDWPGTHNMIPGKDGTLTSLHMSLPRDRSTRWCGALRQLWTLRAVHLSMEHVSDLCVLEFSVVLGTLPAVRQLHIRAAKQAPVDSKPVWEVFVGTATGAPKLQSLSLENCFKSRGRTGGTAQTAHCLGHLSMLTELTHLSLRDNAINAFTASVLAGAMRAATGLCAISAGNACYGPHMVAEACSRPGLAALRAVDLGHSGGVPFELLVPCVQPGGGGVLGHVTALNLERCCIGVETVLELGKLLRGMRALESLNLAGNRMKDRGLRRLARVLRGMRKLKDLDVGNNHAGERGLVMTCNALWEAWGQGGEAPRRLGVAGGYALGELSDTGAAALSMMLPRLESLEVLDLRGLQVGRRVARDVMELLPQFGCLHTVQFSVAGGHELVDEADGTACEGVVAAEVALAAGMALRHVVVSTGDDGAFRRLAAAIGRAAPPVQVSRGPLWRREDEEPEPNWDLLEAASDVEMGDDLARMCEVEDMMGFCPEDEDDIMSEEESHEGFGDELDLELGEGAMWECW